MSDTVRAIIALSRAIDDAADKQCGCAGDQCSIAIGLLDEVVKYIHRDYELSQSDVKELRNEFGDIFKRHLGEVFE